jgi:pimeloyl-ACP methyl ester carboxylesterase
MTHVEKSYQLPIHVETHGSGRPILLIHGFAGSAFSWRYWVQDLARDHRVVLVDLKGHGSAPAPRDGRYSPADQADLVYRHLVHEDLSDVTLVGHSMGGAVTLLVALRGLDEGDARVSRMALVAGAAFPQPLPPFIKMARGPLGRMVLRFLPKRGLVRRVLRSIVHDPAEVSESQVLGYSEPLRSRAHQIAILETAAQLVPEDSEAVTSRFPDLHLPTLLLWGEHDHVVPLWVGERLADVLPHATLQVLEDCGHLPAEEKPTESLEVFRGFLKNNP